MNRRKWVITYLHSGYRKYCTRSTRYPVLGKL